MEIAELSDLPSADQAAEHENVLLQRWLKLTFLHNLEKRISSDCISIVGGERIRDLRVVDTDWADEKADILLVKVDRAGDFSRYTLRVSGAGSGMSDLLLDPLFCSMEFSFKANCPSDFDCKSQHVAPPLQISEPRLDYLAKDYGSLRQLMLDRLSLLMPDWKERHAADLGVALVELLAFVGDRLSYRQDAVATEAYLGTARNRVSMRRHARLLDYRMHDGCNSRVLVHIKATQTGDDHLLPGADAERHVAGTALATTITSGRCVVTPESAEDAAAEKPALEFFETMHDLTLYRSHNEMNFYTWGEEECSLPKGATAACLEDPEDNRLRLVPGDMVIFMEKPAQEAGGPDNPRVHAVRLTKVRPSASVHATGVRTPGERVVDPLFPEKGYLEIEWHPQDALPFPLWLRSKDAMAVALGNIVLADHGWSKRDQIQLGTEAPFRPSLPGPVTQQGPLPPFARAGSQQEFASAGSLFSLDMEKVTPCARLVQQNVPGAVWRARRDLLDSGRFARNFVVEVEEQGTAYLRFGDGTTGLNPVAGSAFDVCYRVGNGSAGNVGANTITHLVAEGGLHFDALVETVSNPMPARGGVDPESMEQVRQYAPQAFRRQERAVSAADYAEIAERHPEVQKATATIRWTGSWHTVFVTVDRLGAQSADADFLGKIKRYLEWYRMAGYDIEVGGPQYAPIDLAVEVTALSGYFAAHLKEALLSTFGSHDLPDGRRGFFHPDNLTFGQPVYLSRIYAAAMAVEGVASVVVKRFQRWGRKANNEIDEGRLSVGRLEIARLDNDSNFPERGHFEATVKEA